VFVRGQIIAYACCFAIGAVMALVTFLIWKRFWRVSISQLTEKAEISMNDIIFFVALIVDFW
jgi:TRAP-type C4-dicarboxylate transport system permease small subunit